MTIAHLNWGTLRHDFGDPRVAEFVDNIGRVNALAERSAGFVWRHGDESSAGAEVDPEGTSLGGPRAAATLSVWADVQSFAHFVEKTLHGKFLGKRQNWFESSEGPSHVIWPVDPDHRPSMAEAADRIAALAKDGPSDTLYDLGYARKKGWI